MPAMPRRSQRRMKFTAGRQMDMTRLGNAVSFPGIDPRTWTSLAVVNAVNIDTDQGEVFADVTLLPSGETDTARVGSIYAGSGWGFYAPLYEGDEVTVIAPSGDPNQGLVISQRMHSPADPLLDGPASNPDDVWLVAKPGTNLRFVTSAMGQFLVNADGTVSIGSGSSEVDISAATTINLGGAGATHPALLGDIQKAADDAFDTAVEGANDTADEGFITDQANFASDYTAFMNLYNTYTGGPPPAWYPDLANIAQAMYTHVQNLENHVTNLQTLVEAMSGAAVAHTSGRGAVLSVQTFIGK